MVNHPSVAIHLRWAKWNAFCVLLSNREAHINSTIHWFDYEIFEFDMHWSSIYVIAYDFFSSNFFIELIDQSFETWYSGWCVSLWILSNALRWFSLYGSDVIDINDHDNDHNQKFITTSNRSKCKWLYHVVLAGAFHQWTWTILTFSLR